MTVGCHDKPGRGGSAGWQEQWHHSDPSLNVLGLALRDASKMGAGVQVSVGSTEHLGSHPAANNAPGLNINLGNVSNDTSVLGKGADDVLMVNTGDDNVLVVGGGANDQVMVGTGNNNDLKAGGGDGDFVMVGTGDHNTLMLGHGNDDSVLLGGGSFNALHAGNGDGDALSAMGGNSNLLSAGNGTDDAVNFGTGNHNTLKLGNGDGDSITVNTGNYNLLHSGDGAGDHLQVNSGDFNVLVAGNGAGDTVTVENGGHNLLAAGDGANDSIEFLNGDGNTVLAGNGADDTVSFGFGDGNTIVVGNGAGDQVSGGFGDGNMFVTGAGNDTVHTGGGADFVYVDDHTETSDPKDPFHLTTTDSLAQNLFADGGNGTFALQSNGHALGTTVMTGGGGVEKYWLGGDWGGAVITDFNAAHGDRIMLGGVTVGDLASLGPIHTQYVHSAYDTANSGNVDLLITFGDSPSASQSITLIDFRPQDTGGKGGTAQFDDVTFHNPAASEAVLSKLFDFSQADNAAVTNQIAQLAAEHVVLH